MSDPHAQPQKTGKVMIWLAWLLALGLLTLIFSDWVERQRNPNRDVEGRLTEQGIREVVLQRNRAGHYFASGRINGHEVTYLLDTGATGVSIPASLARDIGLERGRSYPVMTANGQIMVYQTRLRRLELGTIVLHDIRGHINPRVSGDEVLLGMTVLKELEIIQREDRLTLRQHPK